MKSKSTECIICQKPLGQESRDLEYRVCHEHRNCSICNEPLNPREVRLCHELALKDSTEVDIIHSRCDILRRSRSSQLDTTVISQQDLDRLNIARLMVDPDMNVSQDTNEKTAMLFSEKFVAGMSLDQKFYHLHMMEACVAAISIAIKRDPKAKEMRESLAKIEKQRLRASQEAATSSRSVTKAPDDEKEILLAEFMRINNIKERKIGLKIWSDRAKAIQGLMSAGVPQNVAQDAVDKELVKRGTLQTPQKPEVIQ